MGTSSGALAGSLFAAGYTPQQVHLPFHGRYTQRLKICSKSQLSFNAACVGSR